MTVSSGLQKYFDAQHKKKSAQDMKKRFADLEGKIDPAFMQSFTNFHDKIMDIVDENPDSSDIVMQEVDDLEKNIERTKGSYDMKKAATIIKNSEKI